MDNIGGRKFILTIISMAIILIIFTIMLFKGWLTAEYCIQFLNYIVIIVGIFMGVNTAQKFLPKGEKKNEK